MTNRNAGLLDALIEIGKERQQVLANLKVAYESHDFENTLVYVGQLLGLNEKVKGLEHEKSH